MLGPFLYGLSHVRAVGLISASDLLGQFTATGSTVPDYTSSSANNGGSVGDIGFSSPQYTALDTTNHRLFVSDGSNNRVLVFNLTNSNSLSDYTADNVIGQANFTSNSAAVTSTGLSAPRGLAYDSTANRLFVAQSSANRVTVYDLSGGITDGMAASNVLGQSLFTTSAAATTKPGLSAPLGIAYDETNFNLYVADSNNNRVIKYNFPSGVISDGMNASSVLGQTLYTTSAVATTQSGLSSPQDVGLGTVSGHLQLFIADQGNSRVIIHDINAGITNGQNATNVLGHTDYVTGLNGSASSLLMGLPSGVKLDASTTKLYVVDTLFSRVTIYNLSGGITNGQAAANVLGQTTFNASSNATTQSRLSFPTGLAIDSSNSKLYIVDTVNNRVIMHSISSLSDGQSASDAAGHTTLGAPYTYGTTPQYTQSSANSGGSIDSVGFDTPNSTAIDTTNHRMYVAEGGNHRVLVFNLDSDNDPSDNEADYVIGQSSFNTNTTGLTSSTMTTALSIANDVSGNRLFVLDGGNKRVLVYDTSALATGMSASKVIGQPDFTTNGTSYTQNTFGDAYGIAFDSTDNRLFVGDGGRILVFNVGSSMADITNGMNATNVLGQADFTTTACTVTQKSVCRAEQLYYDTDSSRLFAADSTNNRVMIFDLSGGITDNMDAANVIGQADFTTSTASATQSGLTDPTGVVYDQESRQLFVSDSNDNRVLLYDLTDLSNGMNASAVLGQANYTDVSSGATQTQFDSLRYLDFDSSNRRLFVSDTSNNRVMIFDLISLDTTGLESGVGGTPYDMDLSTSNDQGTVSFELVSGSLPPGLSFDSSGISGTPTSSGTYNFTARAVDSISPFSFFSNIRDYVIVTSGAGGGGGGGGNQYPSVSITSPSNGTSFSSFFPINIVASAVDSDGTIEDVSIFVNGTQIANGSTPTFSTYWTPSSFGTYTFTAKARDNDNDITTSAPVVVTIGTTTTENCTTNPSLPGCTDEEEETCATNPSLPGCVANETCDTNPSLPGCTDEEEETCATNPSLPGCVATETCDTNPSLPGCTDEEPVDECENPTTTWDVIRCEIIQTFEYTEDVFTTSYLQMKAVVVNPLGTPITRTIAVVGLLAGAFFSVLPRLFSSTFSFSEIFLLPARLWSAFLTAIGLKKRVRPWGTVYDSVTKQPLDPVVVSLRSLETGQEVASSITDLDGRYGFLVPVGHYQLLAKKTHYAFPSLKLVGKTRDEIYLDLYFGNTIEIKHDGEVITKNIPMDPESFDWNEFAKKDEKLMRFYSVRDIWMVRISDALFSAGFITSVISVASAGTTFNWLIFALYIVILVFREMGFKQQKAGRILRADGTPVSYGVLKLYQNGTNFEIATKVADELGRYYCLLPNGTYTTSIDKKNPDMSYTNIKQGESVEVKKGFLGKIFKL